MNINNEIYNKKADSWWNDEEDGTFASLRHLGSAKTDYIIAVLNDKFNYKNRTMLDIGCGGGLLSEELSKIGLKVTGLDPSCESIEVAKEHALQENLKIEYFEGSGEKLPFESGSFDFVCCCDVLEHVTDLEAVISEIARVLKTGGVFFYDTINRTLMSKLVMIKAMQEWKSTAFVAPNVHVWHQFIKPKELIQILDKYDLVNQETRGLSPSMNFILHYFNLRKRVKRKISWQELGKKLNVHINKNKTCSYVGYAIKQ